MNSNQKTEGGKPMFYQAELAMLQSVFNKCLIQTLLLDPRAPLSEQADMGLRQLLGNQNPVSLYQRVGELSPRTLYGFTDVFHCRYQFLVLPDTQRETVLAIGPFMTERLSRRQLLEIAEQHHIPARRVKQVEMLLNEVPRCPSPAPLYAVLDAFAERLWEPEGYTAVDISREIGGLFVFAEEPPEESPQETILWNIQLMERRYACENDLIRAVANGQANKAEMLLAALKENPFEQRLNDRLRNLKNYCIIMNTLLRKAVEQGGVHPLYIDRVSSAFAHKIETTATWEDFMALWEEMVRKYCLLVKKHAIKAYSRLVQQVITRVDFDLTADLSLNATAKSLNVNASYLSTLFKRETGTTITEYVNRKRMDHAAYLLSTTQMPISAVAQSCGIQDDNYFTKIFKKYAQKTPKQFRQEQNHFRKG
jgi:AraC-like DNA-binding protein